MGTLSMAWRLPDLSWEEAEDALEVAVRRPGDPAGPVLREPIAPLLHAVWTVDAPDHRRFVSERHLAAWGIAPDALRGHASRRLASSLPEPRTAAHGIVFHGNAAAILLPAWRGALGADVRIAVPAVDEIRVADEATDLPAWIAAVVARWESADHPVSPAIYDASLAPVTTPEPAWWALQRGLGTAYAAQASDDLPLLPFRIARSRGDRWTEVRWDGRTDAWLPQVDRVVLPSGPTPWSAWIDALEPGAFDPPRWRPRQGSGRS
jgi:hypothetical protein